MDMVDEAISGVLKVIRKNQEDGKDVDFICLMGDIFDTHRNLQMDHRKKAIDFIKKLAEIKPTVVLIGNHDRISNKDRMSDLHPFYGMDDIPGKLFIINKAKTINLHSRRHTVLFMPYVPAGEFIEAINQFLEAKHTRGELNHIKSIEDFSLIMGHQEFYGAQYGPIESTKGDKWPLHYPQVISGHIHTRVRLQENVYYTGSLFPITIDESNDKGLIHVVYNVKQRELNTKCTRVVTSQKTIMTIDAKDESAIAEMLILDREKTKYIVKGTHAEISQVREKMKGKKINWVPDVRVEFNGIVTSSFDDLLKSKIQEVEIKNMLEMLLSV